ncbi:MAG: hypothetical protein Q7S33_01940 [Nanoarchaeota archaeon]|nr:hypothetical protein [Nanoarchaeota archaeon]
MTLDITFHVGMYSDEHKPLVKSARDVHVIMNDGCEIFLDESDIQLTEAQRDNIKAMRNSDSRKQFLFYMNKGLVDKWYFDTDEGKLEIHCPKCSQNYIITKEEYDSAYQKFLEFGS